MLDESGNVVLTFPVGSAVLGDGVTENSVPRCSAVVDTTIDIRLLF